MSPDISLSEPILTCVETTSGYEAPLTMALIKPRLKKKQNQKKVGWLRLKDKGLNESEDAYITFGKRCSNLVIKIESWKGVSRSCRRSRDPNSPTDHSI